MSFGFVIFQERRAMFMAPAYLWAAIAGDLVEYHPPHQRAVLELLLEAPKEHPLMDGVPAHADVLAEMRRTIPILVSALAIEHHAGFIAGFTRAGHGDCVISVLGQLHRMVCGALGHERCPHITYREVRGNREYMLRVLWTGDLHLQVWCRDGAMHHHAAVGKLAPIPAAGCTAAEDLRDYAALLYGDVPLHIAQTGRYPSQPGQASALFLDLAAALEPAFNIANGSWSVKTKACEVSALRALSNRAGLVVPAEVDVGVIPEDRLRDTVHLLSEVVSALSRDRQHPYLARFGREVDFAPPAW